jgi:hypothetical protein
MISLLSSKELKKMLVLKLVPTAMVRAEHIYGIVTLVVDAMAQEKFQDAN